VPEYAFDIQLNAVACTKADTEAETRQRLAELEEEFELDYTTDREGGRQEVWLTAASMSHHPDQARRFEPDPEPVPAMPLYRTGCGNYQSAFDVIKQPGWRCFEDASGDNSTWLSPDAQLAVEFGPETDAPALAPLWRITYRNPDPYRRDHNSFSAYFTGDTPSEAIAAFLAALTATSARPEIQDVAPAGEANIDG